MTWAKLDDGFYRHPKARAAGKDGRALFVAGLCWAAAHLSDGFIAKAELGLIAAEAEVRPGPTARRLVEVGMWEEVENGWSIHDYLDYNPTAEAALEVRRKRAEAGRVGGRKSRPPGSKPKAQTEAKMEANALASAQANGKQNRTPSPYPSIETTSSYALTRGPDTPDDDNHRERVLATVAALAKLDLARRVAEVGPVGDEESWLKSVREGRRLKNADDISALVAQHPDQTPEQLAELLAPAPAPSTNGRRTDDRLDEQQRALLAGAAQGMLKVKQIRDEPVDPEANVSHIHELKAKFHLGQEEW